MSEINELKKILKKHEERILKLEKSIKPNSKSTPLSDEQVILNLIKHGFFNKSKKSNDIKKELKTRAQFNSKAKYGNILKKLTSENKLKRKQLDHQWAYLKVN